MNAGYAAAMARARARLGAVPFDTVQTRWGTVQYLDQGDGLPLLWSHGVPGGYDNVRELTDLYVGTECRAIGPSRFGYLGSAMPEDATPADQADAYVDLLDQLRIERVVMIGFSAGGPAAIQFALRHAERAHALIVMSSYLPGMGARSFPKALHSMHWSPNPRRTGTRSRRSACRLFWCTPRTIPSPPMSTYRARPPASSARGWSPSRRAVTSSCVTPARSAPP
jgi:pimeloyl-ACP methyl ester carboxylesterase